MVRCSISRILIVASAVVGVLFGTSFVHGSLTSQAGYSSAGWRDIQTGAGGRNMLSPHQLTLGGRDGVRSLVVMRTQRHSIIRPDIAWPLGRGDKPIFRVVYEVNSYSDRVWTPTLGAGLPHLRGWERF